MLEQRSNIKVANLLGRNARECYSELVEAVGTMPFCTELSRGGPGISPSQYGHFDVGILFYHSELRLSYN